MLRLVESAVCIDLPRPQHVQLVVLHGIWGRNIVVEEWGHGGGVLIVASGIDKCWLILGCSKHTSLWSVSIAPPCEVFCSVVWWLIHDSHTGPDLDSVLADLGQESGIIKESA